MSLLDKGKKVVQTVLEPNEYEVLASAAKSRKLTIKEAARRALIEWGEASLDMREDPLFKLKPTSFKLKVRADKIDDFLYRKA